MAVIPGYDTVTCFGKWSGQERDQGLCGPAELQDERQHMYRKGDMYSRDAAVTTYRFELISSHRRNCPIDAVNMQADFYPARLGARTTLDFLKQNHESCWRWLHPRSKPAYGSEQKPSGVDQTRVFLILIPTNGVTLGLFATFAWIVITLEVFSEGQLYQN